MSLMDFKYKRPKPLHFTERPETKSGKGYRSGVNTIDVTGAAELIKTSLPALKGIVTLEALTAISDVMTHLLANAQPRVPVDSGELRESGTASVTFGKVAIKGGSSRIVAKGRADGSIIAYRNNISAINVKGSNAKNISGIVSYDRSNADGEDIALWAHEDLLPYGSGMSPEARTSGTGPKYLENAFNENKLKYTQILRLAFEKRLSINLTGIMNVTKKAGDEWVVDEGVVNIANYAKRSQQATDAWFARHNQGD